MSAFYIDIGNKSEEEAESVKCEFEKILPEIDMEFHSTVVTGTSYRFGVDWSCSNEPMKVYYGIPDGMRVPKSKKRRIKKKFAKRVMRYYVNNR